MSKKERFAAKEAELTQATKEMLATANLTKQLTTDVKSGTAPKSDLTKAVTKLQQQNHKVKILTAESKILGGWTVGDLTTPAPPESKRKNWLLYLIISLSFIYLLKG